MAVSAGLLRRGWSTRAAGVLAGCLTLPLVAAAHIVLDPDVAHQMLVGIAQLHRQSRAASGAGVESLYDLGAKAQELVDLLNQDLSSHGRTDALAQLVVKRLEAYQVQVAFSSPEERFVYDQAAFREYLDRAPAGRHAAAARFRLIARAFYATVAPDPARLVNTDVASLLAAVAEEERFLEDYPQDPTTRQVRFFLGVDCYRLSRNVGAGDGAARYRRLSRQHLEAVRAQSPGSVEARAADALLEALRKPGQP